MIQKISLLETEKLLETVRGTIEKQNYTKQHKEGIKKFLDSIFLKLYDHQKNVWDYLLKGGRYAFLVWHRRSGKDILAFYWTIHQALSIKGDYWYILPNYPVAKRNMWTGKMYDGTKYLDLIPSVYVEKKLENELKIYLKNGSIISFMSAENYDTIFRGGNPRGIVLSEFAFMDRNVFSTLRPILAPEEHKGWCIFITTPQGRNHAWRLYNTLTSDWYKEILTVDETIGHNKKRIISEKFVEEERIAGMLEHEIQREYYCEFSASVGGAYYANEMKDAKEEDRITNIIAEPHKAVYTCWDLGINDPTIIWLVQIRGDKWFFFDYIEGVNEGADYYIDILRNKALKNKYFYKYHILPHDVKKREFKDGISRLEYIRNQFSNLSLGDVVVAKISSVNEGISLVKRELRRCFFDKSNCKNGIDALIQYSQFYRKETGEYSDKPKDDWTSHASDAFRYGVIGLTTYSTPFNSRKVVNKSHLTEDYLDN